MLVATAGCRHLWFLTRWHVPLPPPASLPPPSLQTTLERCCWRSPFPTTLPPSSNSSSSAALHSCLRRHPLMAVEAAVAAGACSRQPGATQWPGSSRLEGLSTSSSSSSSGGRHPPGPPKAAARPLRSLVAPPQRQGPLPWQVTPTASPGPPLAASSGTAAPGSLRPQAPRPLRPAAGPAGSAEPQAGSSTTGGSHVLQLASQLSLAELRRLCESKGLAASGTKAQLASRLVERMAQEGGQR